MPKNTNPHPHGNFFWTTLDWESNAKRRLKRDNIL